MKRAIITLFAICIAHVFAIKQHSVDYRYPLDARIIQGTLNHTNFVHALYEVNENKTEIDYYLISDSNSCGSSKLEMDKNVTFHNDFRIIPLNQENILLLIFGHRPMSGYQVKIQIVNLSSCQKSKIEIPTKRELTDLKITRYSDSFDIYFKDSSLCDNKYCRRSYDFQGNLLSIPFATFPSDVLLVQPVGADLRSSSHVAVTTMKKRKIVNLVKDNMLNVLTEIGPESHLPTGNRDLTPDISTSHNFISIAYRMNFTSLVVMQFSLEGHLQFQTAIEYGYFVRTARILNAPNRGVYLVASECDRYHCSDDENKYLIKKINANGKEVGSISLSLPLPGVLEDLSFYENDQFYCLTRAQLSLGAVDLYYFKKVDIHTKCFTDDDLIK
ncbi:uncharacterized protein LOC131665345 [Phymastichus coffea]|uniref:uncharacterized protein LOC131665345 n=1 Tax=Phymastichus coffea TaxID=108790 RepID=UPI00273BDF39|nr:uncharacterized protein LOC131665345 [Phymastichus coffea]